jgi:phosphoribosyl-dephospho-CoA transferase
MVVLQVHDLARIDPRVPDTWIGAESWVADSLQRAPWVVVRRARNERSIPVGVRGARRSQRFAASIVPADVRESVSPMDICKRSATIDPPPNAKLARVFRALADFAATRELRVAPIGSYGFELASGVRVTHDASDLDVLVPAGGVSRGTLRLLASFIERLTAETGVRIDAELSYANGSVMLEEVLGGQCLVLFKTENGPRLLTCPV